MNYTAAEQKVIDAYTAYAGISPETVMPLPHSASDRMYFRVKAGDKTVIATVSPDADETHAFIYLSGHFASCNLPVPKVLHYQKDAGVYLQTDLGDITLHAAMSEEPGRAYSWCAQALEQLVRFQVQGAEGLDFSNCFPRHAFDEISLLWDLNYFKYSFLKPSGIEFHEDRLERDFRKITALLTEDEKSYFLYRDFQSRNIMLHDNGLFFIDFQGGRRGSLCYDPASFIYSARSPFPMQDRDRLLGHYRDELKKHIDSLDRFDHDFPYFLLLRILQTFGAYGYRGWYERKQAFSDILPRAIGNLNELMPRFHFLNSFPELKKVVEQIADYGVRKKNEYTPSGKELTVSVFSFSYKHGMPVDDSGNGGGFVFDCRALPNPGKYDTYKSQSGQDAAVIDFLKKQPEVEQFVQQASVMVKASVEKYLSRGFTNLMVSFGCTGGQHRSVYCAERVAELIQSICPVKVTVAHLRKEAWGKESGQ